MIWNCEIEYPIGNGLCGKRWFTVETDRDNMMIAMALAFKEGGPDCHVVSVEKEGLDKGNGDGV